MDGQGIQKIIDTAQEANAIRIVEIGGMTYSRDGLSAVLEKRPVCTPLGLSSLTGLVDLIKADVDGWIESGAAPIVHVVSPTQVVLWGKQMDDDFLTRPCFAAVTARVPSFKFDEFHRREAFHISILSVFDDVASRDEVVAFVGNIKSERSVEATDDGVSQSVSARSGVSSALIRPAVVPNPVILAPYRSFQEIQPVESPFIFRVRGGGDEGEIQCGLFEADGGAWVRHTVDEIYAWLKASLTGVPVHIVR